MHLITRIFHLSHAKGLFQSQSFGRELLRVSNMTSTESRSSSLQVEDACEKVSPTNETQTKRRPSNITEVQLDGVTYTKVREGQGDVLFPAANAVFYNPVQEFNRDISISILRVFAQDYKKAGKDLDKRKRREAYRRSLLKKTNGENSAAEAARVDNSPASELCSTDNSDAVSAALTIDAPASNNTISPSCSDEEDNSSSSSSGDDVSGLRVLDALAASGLRSIRYAKEVPGMKDIITNDLSKDAVDCIQRNIEYNRLGHLITASHSDASLLLYLNRSSGGVDERFDVIDLDPYGSPHLFLDGAVQAVAEGGLLMVTCTDMGVLCGNSPDTCHAKYGATALKTKACHEMALRIALQSLESHANRYGRYIEPLISISADFYIRVAVRVFSSPFRVKESYTKVGQVYRCVGCDTCTTLPLGKIEVNGKSVRHKLSTGPPVADKCEHCDSRHEIAGPIWLAPMHDQQFLQRLLDDEPPPTRPQLGTHRRIQGMVQMMLEELPDVPLYYVHDRLCGTVGSMTGKIHRFKSAILNAGYRVSSSHCHKASIKTDAPARVVWDIVRAHQKTQQSDRMKNSKNEPGCAILNKETITKVDFSPHPDANPESREKSLLRFQTNPEPFWGPSTRSSTKVLGQSQQDKKKKNQGRNRYKQQRDGKFPAKEGEDGHRGMDVSEAVDDDSDASNDAAAPTDQRYEGGKENKTIDSNVNMEEQDLETKQALKRMKLDPK